MMLRKTAVLIAMVFATLTTAAGAQVYVRIGPPAPRYEPAPPPPPYRHAAWDPGHWHWNGGRYVWVHGHYVHGRGHWVTGHWRQGPNGWHWVNGHWV
jgi:hypothetical protein